MPTPRQIDKLNQKLEYTKKRIELHQAEHTLRQINNPKAAVGYNSADTRARWQKNWTLKQGTADQLTLFDRRTLSDRSADFYRNNAIGKSAIDTTAMAVIGKGVRPQSNVNAGILGFDEDQADEFQDSTEYRFSRWATSIECDAYRKKNFYELQYLAFQTYLIKGEVFVLLPRKTRGGVKRMTVQLIDPDRVGNPGISVSDTYRDGIELNEQGEPIAYYISKKDTFFLNYADFEKIPAFGNASQRRNVLHVFKQDFIGQSRGVPILSTIMEDLKLADRSKKNELINQAVSTMFTAFIKSNRDNALFNPFNVQADAQDAEDGEEDLEYSMDPGAFFRLKPGEDLTFANPTRQISQFKEFIHIICQQVGMAIGVPYEILVKEVNSNFSAHKAARLEAWRFFIRERTNFNWAFNTPIYQEWLGDEVAYGGLIAPGFFDSSEYRDAYSGVEWEGEGMGQVDPEGDTNAAVMRIQNNLSTFEKETQIIGGDFETNIRRKSREVSKLKKLGLWIDPAQPGLFDSRTQAEPEQETEPAGWRGNDDQATI